MSEAWAEVACIVPAELVDQLAEFLVDLSGRGVCIDNQIVDTFSLDTVAEAPLMTVRAYFATGTDLERQVSEVTEILANLCAGHSGFDVQPPIVSMVRQEDWATSWKQHFHTSPVGRRLVLKPSWEEFAASGEQVVIEIDPGMAFGTGTHATTRLCLEALERIFDSIPPLALAKTATRPEVLDVGTGSGVLAIAARKLGAGRIVAVDIDIEAVQVALDNLANNGVTSDLNVSTTSLALIDGNFTIVLANILAEDLIQMAPDLAAHLLPGGLLILSGILTEREQGVMTAFSSCGLRLEEATHQEEWSCLVYRREA
jgi:ribosomal protein L11 methyltransferase